MQCPNCHGNIPDNSKFCTLCGTRIPEAANPSAAKPEYSSQPYSAPAGSSVYGASAGSSVQKVLNGVDFRHFDLRGLVTIEAILWIIPLLGLFFPWMEVPSYLGKSKGIIFGIFELGKSDFPWEVSFMVWALVIATIGMVVIGFIQVLQHLPSKVTAIFGIVGILTCVFYIIVLSLQDTVLSAGSSLVDIKWTLIGTLMPIAVWVLLIGHIWQIWMMAVQGQRLK